MNSNGNKVRCALFLLAFSEAAPTKPHAFWTGVGSEIVRAVPDRTPAERLDTVARRLIGGGEQRFRTCALASVKCRLPWSVL